MEFTSETIGYLIQEPITIELLDEHGNKLSEAETLVLIKPGLDEPAMSDALIERLGIVILRAKSGLWRHINDSETVVRRSM
ncbi:MAG: hypothetical protein DRJ40_00990 [Thermoprotei archaeon]|nr:MAG: hypothetical protein DRJ40_00990 [Thermoprotei archaeon]